MKRYTLYRLIFVCVIFPILLLVQSEYVYSQSSSATAANDQTEQESDAETTDEKAESEKADDDDQTKERKEKPSRRRGGGFLANSKKSREFVAAFEPVVSSTSDAVVKITDGKRQIALGTIVDADGLVLTKLSELRGEIKCKLANGTELKPTVIGIDPDTDLVLLKVSKSDLPLAKLKDLPQPLPGSLLATVDQKPVPLSIGIVSHEARRIPSNRLNSAVIGIFPEDISDRDGVRVNFVVIDSPAEKAGVLVNDVIIEIDDEKILDRAELLEALSLYAPGDQVVLKVKRGDEEIEFDITLGKRRTNSMMERGIRQNQLGSTLSKRRSDFPLALQHDSTLNANQCGGPVVDLDGKIVGINIARDGRVSSLALPVEVVIPVIKKLKSGKYKPQVVNKSEIRQLESMLAKLESEMGDLPEKRNKKEIEFSAGNAVEKEILLQVKEAEERLKKLQARLQEKKKLNKTVVDDLADLESRQRRIERRREPLIEDLKRLKTGIR